MIDNAINNFYNKHTLDIAKGLKKLDTAKIDTMFGLLHSFTSSAQSYKTFFAKFVEMIAKDYKSDFNKFIRDILKLHVVNHEAILHANSTSFELNALLGQSISTERRVLDLMHLFCYSHKYLAFIDRHKPASVNFAIDELVSSGLDLLDGYDLKRIFGRKLLNVTEDERKITYNSLIYFYIQIVRQLPESFFINSGDRERTVDRLKAGYSNSNIDASDSIHKVKQMPNKA